MLQKIKDTLIGWLFYAAIALFVWFIVSSIIFGFRHPWMTNTERLLYIPEALMLKKVSYKDARP